MANLFLTILDMSITASYVILAILVVRLLLKKAPKKYSYYLWAVAAFRLICPVSFEAVFSLFKPLDIPVQNNAMAYVSPAIRYEAQQQDIILSRTCKPCCNNSSYLCSIPCYSIRI